MLFFFTSAISSSLQDCNSDILIDIIGQYNSLKDFNFAVGALKATNKKLFSILSNHSNIKYILKLASNLFANKHLPHLFYLASIGGYLNIVHLFFLIGVSADISDDLGAILSEVSRNKNIKIVNLLVENGANINFQNQRVLTPLMVASSSNNTKILELLIQKGATLDLQDSYGDTAAAHAVKSMNLKAVFVLYKHGTNFNIKNIGNNSAKDMIIGHVLDTGILSCILFVGVIIAIFYVSTIYSGPFNEMCSIRQRLI